jgi:signal transduction histidine kinase
MARSVFITIIILTCSFLNPELYADNRSEDSLTINLNLAIQDNDKEKQIELYYKIGRSVYKKQEYDLAADYFLKMSLLADLQEDRNNLGKALYHLGKSYRKGENHNLAIAKLEELISMPKSVNQEYIDKAHFEASKAYQAISDFEKAYTHQINCLQLREEQNDTSGQMRCLYQLGSIFFYQENYELALDYYQKTKGLAEVISNKMYIYNSVAAIGSTYQSLKNLDKSVYYSKKALALAEAMDHKIGLTYSYANIGENFLLLEQYDSAQLYINKSLNLTEGLNDNGIRATALRLSGKVHLALNKPQKAVQLLDSALNIALKYQYNAHVLDIYLELANTYEVLNNPRECGKYLKSYISLNKTLVNETILEKMGKVQTKYEILKKEKELSEKNNEIEKLYRNVLLGGIIVLLIVLWSNFTSYHNQRKTNNLLAAKNAEIKSQNEQLERSNAELQQFAYIASHDLKEPLRNIGSYASLIKRRYSEKMDEECTEFFSFIQEGVTKMYQLLNDVLDFSRLDYQQNFTTVDTMEVVTQVTMGLNQQIREKRAKIYVSDLPKIKVNETHISQVFQNLISNGLKFTNGKLPEISVSHEYAPEKKHHIFSVKDNGIGFDMVYKEKIFEMFQRLDKNHESDGTGVGLAICKKIVQQYGGKIWVESEPNQGTTFYFTVPSEN